MIVGMRTRGQAARVAAATGGAHLPGKPKPDGTPRLSRYVDVGADFETHRTAVESVSVLFDLFDVTVMVMPRREARASRCRRAGR
jgi:putative transposase